MRTGAPVAPDTGTLEVDPLGPVRLGNSALIPCFHHRPLLLDWIGILGVSRPSFNGTYGVAQRNIPVLLFGVQVP